jgi:hypothetical protein
VKSATANLDIVRGIKAHAEIGGFPHRQRGKQAVLQRSDLERAARLLKQRDMNLVQPSDQESRPFRQRPWAMSGFAMTLFRFPQRTLPASEHRCD